MKGEISYGLHLDWLAGCKKPFSALRGEMRLSGEKRVTSANSNGRVRGNYRDQPNILEWLNALL